MDQPGYTRPEAQRGLGLQCLIAASFGLVSVIFFSFSRRRWPTLYEARAVYMPNLPHLSSSLFGWIGDIVKMNESEVLRYAGLDAYAYIMFFRAAIALLARLTLVSLVFMAPLRWWYSGKFDDMVATISEEEVSHRGPNWFGNYLWVNVAATYVFTIICLMTMRRYTSRVVNVRQAYLGHQKTITDRTLRVSGIPKNLRSKEAIKMYITTLCGTEPENIVLCRKWAILDNLFERRHKLIHQLEQLYADYLGNDATELLKLDFNNSDSDDADVTSNFRYSDYDTFARGFDGTDPRSHPEQVAATAALIDSETGGLKAELHHIFPNKTRPQGRVQSLGFSGPKIDLIDYYSGVLEALDSDICSEREIADSRPVTKMAFVTMKTVANCQVAAQTIFSPQPRTMVGNLAPAPTDIVWHNVYLAPKKRAAYNYVITLVVLIMNAFLTVPLTFIARFLDMNSIERHFPSLAHWLHEHEWMAAFVTDVLPTYVFASFNLVIPYFLSWLSKRQGFVSRSDIELSTVSKNFFYVFVNLFLIFTIESTLFTVSMDEFARHFAEWLIRLSSFYTNLIILQGVGIVLFKLLQPGHVFQFPFLAAQCRTARDRYELYKPQRINYGLVLPNAMFVFIVTLTYSIISRRILIFGLIYFAVSYVVYKYQLLYTMVHPQHSNAKVWIAIVRRVHLGIGVFHLAMISVLVSQTAFTWALLILPLSVFLLGFCYDFEKFSRPLLDFVAIEALHQETVDTNGLGTYRPTDTVGSSASESPQSSRNNSEGMLRRVGELASGELGIRSADRDPVNPDGPLPDGDNLWDTHGTHEATIDEVRENGQVYVNRNMVSPLDGPWLATDAFTCIVANQDGLQRRPIPQHEWM